eukprot:22303_1
MAHTFSISSAMWPWTIVISLICSILNQYGLSQLITSTTTDPIGEYYIASCHLQSEPCVIDCSLNVTHDPLQIGCLGVTIDATIHPSNISSLTVLCNDASICQNAKILCPEDGVCDIMCNGQTSCYEMDIHVQTVSRLSLFCSGSQACFKISLHDMQTLSPPDVHGVLQITCIGTDACARAFFSASYLESISVNCSIFSGRYRLHYACRQAEFNFTHSTFISIDCIGSYACKETRISVDNSQQMIVNCVENVYIYWSCYIMSIAITETYNVSIFCGDYGCQNLGIYPLNIEYLALNSIQSQFVTIHAPSASDFAVLKRFTLECEGESACAELETTYSGRP